MSEPSQEPTHPVLIVTGPPRDGDALALESLGFEKVMGSGPDCHFRLQAGNVDHNHARLVWEGRGVMLTDLGSAAGTYVNGEKIGTDHLLQDGDRICLGPPGSKQSVKLLARIPAESAMPAPLMLAPEKDPFGFGEEPPMLDLLPAEPAAPAATLMPPPPAAAPVVSAPAAPERSAPVAGPAIIFDTPPPAAAAARPARVETPPPAAQPSRPRRPGPDVMELPSIEAPPAEGGGVSVDAAPAKPARPPRAPIAMPEIPRVVWLAAAVLVLAALGWFAYQRFKPPVPTLTALTPAQAEPRQSVVLAGTGFSAEPSRNTVQVGARTADVTAASETQVTITLPADLDTGGTPNVPVTVETSGGKSNPVFLRVRRLPHGLKLENDVALPGAEVTVIGENLELKPLMVRVAGIPSDLIEADARHVRFRVPTAVPFEEGRTVTVTVQVGNDSAPALQLLLGKLPLVAETAPKAGRPGDRVTLRGRGFDAQALGNAVTFGAEPALVLTASETELVALVPHVQASAGELDVPVVVRARGSASSGSRSFALQRPSSAIFVPYFFAAPVPEDPGGSRALVSTALGPLLVLGSPEGAPSVAERAARVAAALNAVFSSKTPLELREAPAPSVVATGRGDVIVTATAADAAAYAPPLAPAGASRPAPRALAAHWVAMLQDMQSLFVSRQRPVRVVQASPRGKVLLDLYAEGERLGGPGGGVPTRLVEPLPFPVARALREMAFVVPSQGQATAAAAVTGTWSGTLQEDGVGERAMQLRVRMDGSRLAGAMTSRSGALGMEIPVLDLAYDKGVLSFRTTSGAAARRYRATLEGATLAGTVHTIEAAAPVVGRFTLRYTE